MLDLLPKLFIALAAGCRPHAFYLGASTPFQKQTLDLLGLSAGPVTLQPTIIDANSIPFLQADELVVPFIGDRPPPNVFDAAKYRLLQEVLALPPRRP